MDVSYGNFSICKMIAKCIYISLMLCKMCVCVLYMSIELMRSQQKKCLSKHLNEMSLIKGFMVKSKSNFDKNDLTAKSFNWFLFQIYWNGVQFPIQYFIIYRKFPFSQIKRIVFVKGTIDSKRNNKKGKWRELPALYIC